MEYKTHTTRYILAGIALLFAIAFILIIKDGSNDIDDIEVINTDIPKKISTSSPVSTNTHSHSSVSDEPLATVIATGLNIPWDLAFLPDQSLLVTERVGNLVHVKNDGSKISIKLPHSIPKGEGGLLGIVLHPNFSTNKFIYLYMTTQSSTNGTKNAVFRYKYEDEKLSDEKTIISNIPGAIYHDGGRMEFGPDGFLYITTGDATSENIAQDLKSLGGKILRLTDEGGIPNDNPFGTAVYSYGHRNSQGLAWDDKGQLWSTEHGRSGITTGMDEINLIEKGKNYGWPDIEGDKTKTGMVNPVLHSGAKSTWAPASLLYFDGKLFFGGLLGEALYEVTINGNSVSNLKSHFKNEYGRIRTVRLGPDGMFYITTSNRDGRGKSINADDRIIKINPVKIQSYLQ